jgi:filamentous hemagglutinin
MHWHLIGSQFDPNHGNDPNATMQLISHAVLGALLAEANGGNAGSGAAAAAGGELAAKFITDYLYGGDPSRLGEQEKQNILALSQAVGALAGASGGDGLSGAGLGAILAKDAVENNFLTPGQANAFAEKLKECAGDSACQQSVQEEARQLSQKQDMDLRSTCAISSSSKACNSYVAAATEYRYSLLGESLGIEDDQRRSSEEIGTFAHSADGSLYRGLIFENGGLQPVYILPQEYTIAGLAQWTGSVQESVNDNGWWSTETGQILAFGILKVAARKVSGILNISGDNGGFGKGAEVPAAKPAVPSTGSQPESAFGGQVGKSGGFGADLTEISAKQLDRKFKHAADFGVVTTKKNPETVTQYGDAIKSHMSSPTTIQQGTYGLVPGSKVFFDSKTNNAVVLDGSGRFVTGFKLYNGTSQYENFIKNGVLR